VKQGRVIVTVTCAACRGKDARRAIAEVLDSDIGEIVRWTIARQRTNVRDEQGHIIGAKLRHNVPTEITLSSNRAGAECRDHGRVDPGSYTDDLRLAVVEYRRSGRRQWVRAAPLAYREMNRLRDLHRRPR
jgi:hypothetical protein